MTNHEIGATPLYQGQRVWFEWQSKHDRVSVAWTSGGIATCAAIVAVGSVAGFVRAGLIT